jgi:hypothetical protein
MAAIETTDKFDIGTVAHQMLLEGEDSCVVIDAADWRTSAAKAERDAVRAIGKTALLTRQYEAVCEMVTAFREQRPDAFTDGEPEQTIIWQEDDLWCRARLDWLRYSGKIEDYKTTSASANPERWGRAIFDTGYDIQAAHYMRAVETLGFPPSFVFHVQETEPPYLVSTLALAPSTALLAEKKRLYALEAWRNGLRKNSWPGYPKRTAYVELPSWHETLWLEKEGGL